MSFLQWLKQPFVWLTQGAVYTGGKAVTAARNTTLLVALSALATGTGIGLHIPQPAPHLMLPNKIQVGLNEPIRLDAETNTSNPVEWSTTAEEGTYELMPFGNSAVAHFHTKGIYRVHARQARGGHITCACTHVVVGDVEPPTPPVPPTPPTPPIPPTPPAPIPAKGLHVMIVLDTADISGLPEAQAQALTATSIRQYLNATCPVGPDGKTHEWRIWDRSVDATNESKLWQDAFKLADSKKLPCVIVSNGTTGEVVDLPKDTDGLLTLLKKYGG